MKSPALTGTVKIWFGLLKMALMHQLPINQDFYRSWGTKEELLTQTFNCWWNRKGKALFERAVPKVSLEGVTEEALTVRIPTSLTAVQVKRQIGEVVTKQRGTKRLRKKPSLAFTGDTNFKRLKQYERFLEIEFDSRYAGKTIEDKTEALRNVYRRIKARLEKQKKTMQLSGKAQVSKKLVFRDPDTFGSESKLRRGIDTKKVSRWRLSGKILLLNVAEGQFPGRGYYGPQLAAKLKARLTKLGLEDVGTVVKNKGGGRKREDLTLVRVRKSKADREAQSLKAYGTSKGANPVGEGDKRQDDDDLAG